MGNGILAIGLRGVACAVACAFGGASQLELFLSVSRLADPVRVKMDVKASPVPSAAMPDRVCNDGERRQQHGIASKSIVSPESLVRLAQATSAAILLFATE